MGTDTWTRALVLSAVMTLAGGCAQAQKADAAAAARWFDGQGWVTSTEQQGPAQAAGGVVVVAPVAQAAALQAALVRLGFTPRPLNVAGAYQIDSAPGESALLLTHRLVDLSGQIQAPVQVAPNWRTALKVR